ncbi:MAG TPA: porin, partial [Marinobacter adhaerens]|nr:porin [Marinobacter adhaerens]
VMYTSNNLGGLQFKVGLFSPSKVDGVTDAEYTMPRIEANVVYSGDNFSLWSSGFTQDVDSKIGTFDDYTMSGIDFGGSVSLGGLSVRGNYGIT